VEKSKVESRKVETWMEMAQDYDVNSRSASMIKPVRKLFAAAAALFALTAAGCNSGSAGVGGQATGEPTPLPPDQTIKSDLVGTWTVSGKEDAKTTFDGDGTSTYKPDGTFSSRLSKSGYDMNTLGTYRIDGSRVTLIYTKIDLVPPKSADPAEVFKLKPMIQQALNKPADGALAFKGKNSATLTFGTSIETLARR
jgi:hypothetical protein